MMHSVSPVPSTIASYCSSIATTQAGSRRTLATRIVRINRLLFELLSYIDTLAATGPAQNQSSHGQ